MWHTISNKQRIFIRKNQSCKRLLNHEDPEGTRRLEYDALSNKAYGFMGRGD